VKAETVRTLALLAVIAGMGYVGWRAYREMTGAVGAVSGAFGSAYDAVTGLLSDGVAAVASVPDRIVTAVHGPAVPVGGSSLQLRHTTDLPEGSYQAAAMYWSLYPDAVFYD